jgi:hypothetical protein
MFLRGLRSERTTLWAEVERCWMKDSVARAIRKAAGLEQAAMSGSRAMSRFTRETG